MTNIEREIRRSESRLMAVSAGSVFKRCRIVKINSLGELSHVEPAYSCDFTGNEINISLPFLLRFVFRDGPLFLNLYLEQKLLKKRGRELWD